MTLSEAYDAAVKLLEQLIATPRVSREEGAAADLLEAYMRQSLALPDVHRSGHNCWAIAPGYDASRPTLLLNAHLDTVRPVASWQRDPWQPVVETHTAADGSTEQRLYGLGSNDDGASLVCLLHVFAMLSGQPRAYNLMFLASAEEEVSGKNGIEAALPLLPHVDVALVGEPTGMQPAVAEKGLVVLDGTAYGRSGHAARAEGLNALYVALDAIQRLRDHRFDHVSPTLGPVKVTVTGIQAGTVHNVVPDRCTFMVDCRTTDAYSNEEVVAALRQAVAPLNPPEGGGQVGQVTLTPRSTRLQPSGIAPTHPLLRRIVALGRQPFGSPTLSDQALMRFPSLKMGPGQSSRSHTADEFICLHEIREALALYLQVLDGLVLS